MELNPNLRNEKPMTDPQIHGTAKFAWSDMDNPRNRVQPGYNNIGLYDTSLITSVVLPINSSLLTVMLHCSVITTSVYTTPRL